MVRWCARERMTETWPRTETTIKGLAIPRVSASGILILGFFLKILQHLFRSSCYASLLELKPESSSPSFGVVCLCAATCAASLLNVLSHTAVALGALNDTYVLSILVGVGFDVMTRIVQLIWWMGISANLQITTTTNQDLTSLFLLMLMVFYVYHMIVHVRALFLNTSLSRLQTVLTGALNNLRGIPGDGCWDHIFAYTDLGTHLFALLLSYELLQKEGAVVLAIITLTLLAGISYKVLSQIPFSENSGKELASMVKVVGTKNGNITIACSCLVCKRKKERSSNCSAVSFTVNNRDGICQLWLASFEQLSGILELATKP